MTPSLNFENLMKLNKIYIGAEKDRPDWKMLRDFLMKEGPLRKD
jgi:hypothetical protein